jgi:hypothetical protein
MTQMTGGFQIIVSVVGSQTAETGFRAWVHSFEQCPDLLNGEAILQGGESSVKNFWRGLRTRDI